MDERKLSEMFRGAVGDVPPPSFDYRDVAAESNLQRVRRRNALLGGSAIAVAVLAGATVLGVALWRGTDAGTATPAANGPFVADSSGNGEAAPNEVPNEDSDRSFSAESPKQGGTPTGNAGPPGPGSAPSGCEKVDLELAAALAGELQVPVSSNIPADIGCPPGSRGVAFRVGGGVVSLVVILPNAELGNPLAGRPENSALRAALTQDGRHVVLVSEPDGGDNPPYEPALQGMVDRLKAKV